MSVTNIKNKLDFSASNDWKQANIIDIYQEIMALVSNAELMTVTAVENMLMIFLVFGLIRLSCVL